MQAAIEQLIRSGQGDTAAFAELYRGTSAHLFALAIRILRRRDWAEDALQEAFGKIWRHASDYNRDKGSPISWMGTIVRNTSLDRLRRQKRESFSDPEEMLRRLPDESPDPLDRVLGGLEARALQKCMEELSPEQKESISLAYWRGLSHSDLAKTLAKPLGTVKTWLRRGLEQLRECLDR